MGCRMLTKLNKIFLVLWPVLLKQEEFDLDQSRVSCFVESVAKNNSKSNGDCQKPYLNSSD